MIRLLFIVLSTSMFTGAANIEQLTESLQILKQKLITLSDQLSEEPSSESAIDVSDISKLDEYIKKQLAAAAGQTKNRRTESTSTTPSHAATTSATPPTKHRGPTAAEQAAQAAAVEQENRRLAKEHKAAAAVVTPAGVTPKLEIKTEAKADESNEGKETSKISFFEQVMGIPEFPDLKSITIPITKPAFDAFISNLDSNIKNLSQKRYFGTFYLTKLDDPKTYKDELDAKKQLNDLSQATFDYCKQQIFKYILANDARKWTSDEKEWLKIRRTKIKEFIQAPKKEDKEFYIIKHQQTQDDITPTETKFCAGHLEQPTIKELREQTEKKPTPGGGTFNVIVRTKKTPDKFVDVAALQADEKNRDAVFQVASQFNAYEAKSAYSPDDPKKGGVTNFIHDQTQGPAAAISGAPGSILRVYYAFYDKDTDPENWRQTAGHQVEFLSNLKDKIFVNDGYTNFPESRKINSTLAFTDEDYEKIKVGFQHNVQVIRGKGNTIPINNSKQIINQVFTAAVALGQYAKGENKELVKNIATKILDAAYEGTLRSAFLFNKKIVFLTLIGGGVFENDFAWIMGSIGKMIPFIQEAGLQVYLSIYPSTSDLEDDPVIIKKSFEFIKASGGIMQLHTSDTEVQKIKTHEEFDKFIKQDELKKHEASLAKGDRVRGKRQEQQGPD